PVVERNGNVFTVSIDPTLAHRKLRCDRLKLTQILINLLSNAGKFTQDGEILLAATSEDDDSYTLQVIDTGIGMTDQQVTRIFSDYTQASESIASHYGGTGLGLAVTRRLCELMGGSIEVESTPNCGSTFRVRMPRHTDSTDPVKSSSSLQR
ncbi:MAG TPA: ATP-binding protein, partial [Nannocystis exedens]|nr:ATP-binding protein [Nannocystis exedens]